MAFAKAFQEEITLAYYCFALGLAFVTFVFGTIYLRHRDRREQQSREWRQFAEKIYSDYSKLKDKDIPQKISEVRDTFQKLQMKSSITGLDVLRYMLANANYERSETSQLNSLREDLQSIFELFNVCSFNVLLLSGKVHSVPRNIRQGLQDVVSELANIAVPFFQGKQREIILKCLEDFGSVGPERETERRVTNLRLEAAIPYIKSCLRFGESHDMWPHLNAYNEALDTFTRDYSKCSKFSINASKANNDHFQSLLFLSDLETFLQTPTFKEDLERELQQHPIPLEFDVKFKDDDDEHEPVLVKVLHEVRVYIHLCLTNKLKGHNKHEQIKHNMKRLEDVEKTVTSFKTEDMVREIFARFMRDLKTLQASYSHRINPKLCGELGDLLQKTLQDIRNLCQRSDNSLHSISANQETQV